MLFTVFLLETKNRIGYNLHRNLEESASGYFLVTLAFFLTLLFPRIPDHTTN